MTNDDRLEEILDEAAAGQTSEEPTTEDAGVPFPSFAAWLKEKGIELIELDELDGKLEQFLRERCPDGVEIDSPADT
jgi:hypothetical protein